MTVRYFLPYGTVLPTMGHGIAYRRARAEVPRSSLEVLGSCLFQSAAAALKRLTHLKLKKMLCPMSASSSGFRVQRSADLEKADASACPHTVNWVFSVMCSV